MLRRLLPALLCLTALPALAQTITVTAGGITIGTFSSPTYAVITSTNLMDTTGQVKLNGTACFAPVDQNANPLGTALASGGQIGTNVVCANVVDGAITSSVSTGGSPFTLVSTLFTVPANRCYNLTVTQSSDGSTTLGGGTSSYQSGYNCIQMNSGWCTTISGVYTCNLDDYTPSTPTVPLTEAAIDATARAEALAALQPSNDLSDLTSAATARTNLGLGSAATQSSSAFDAAGAAATAQSNAEAASDPAGSAATAQSNAEAASLAKTNNLSDLASASAARTNLGLGSAATQSSSAFDAAGSAATAQSNAEAASDPAGSATTAQSNAETYAAAQAASAESAAIAASVNLASTSTQTLHGPLVAPWVNNIPDAGEFTGANVGAQIDAACAALSGSYGVAEVNPFVSGGSGGQTYNYNSSGLASNCDLLDLRPTNFQPSANGYENQPYFGGPLFRARFTQQLAQSFDFETLSSVYLEAAAGGVSNNGPSGYKTTMVPFSVRERMNTLGQTYGVDAEVYSSGPSDMTGVFSHVKAHNYWYALADEGPHAIRAEADQDGTVFTATVATVTANTPSSGITTLTLSSQVNPYVVGEQASLIVTASSGSEAPYTTGTITGITGTPPVVTGSGTSWSGYCPGGQAYFALTASKELVSPYLPYIVPVASFNSNTSLTLSYQIPPQGSAAYTLGGTYTGAYTLYCGEQIQTTDFVGQSYTISSLTACVSPFAAGSSYTPVNQANAGCVTSGSGPFSAGDTVAVYPAYNTAASTIYVLGSKLFNDGLGSMLFMSDNSGTEASWLNAAWIAANGHYTYGLELGGNGGFFVNADIFVTNSYNSNTVPVIKVTSNATQYQEMWSIDNASSTYMGEEFDRTNSLLMPYGGAGFLLQSGYRNCSISGNTATIFPGLGDVECTLTANITTVTVSSTTGAGLLAGVHLTTLICQNSTGGYTWAWPSSFHGGTTIGATAGLCTEQEWRVNSAATIAYGTPGAANE